MKINEAKIIINLTLIVLLVGISCRKADDRQENLLRLSWPAEPSSFDIVKYNGVNDLKLIWNIYEPLVRISNGKVIPAGAKSWELSDNGLEYTFNLQDNYWNDGVKVTAGDYVNMIRRMAKPSSHFKFSKDYYAIKNFERINHGELSVDSIGVEARDDCTLKISLEHETPNFLSSVELYPERNDIVHRFGDSYGYSPKTLVCCGPFALVEWNHGADLKLVKNARYWGRNAVELETIYIRIIPDKSTEYLEFIADNIDAITVSEDNYIRELRNNAEVYEVKSQTAKTFMFIFNTKDKFLGNVKIRKALSLAIDRKGLCENFDNGLSIPAYGVIPPATMVGDIDYRRQITEPLKETIDANGALSFLQEGIVELGLESPSDIVVSLSCPNDSFSQTMAEFYKQMWEKTLHIKVNIKMMEFATYKSFIWTDKYQIATTAWGGSLEPKFLLSRWLPGNQCQWINEKYNLLLEKAERALNADKRVFFYSEAEKMLVAEEYVIAPIKYGVSSTFFKRHIASPTLNPFDNVGLAKIHMVNHH